MVYINAKSPRTRDIKQQTGSIMQRRDDDIIDSWSRPHFSTSLVPTTNIQDAYFACVYEHRVRLPTSPTIQGMAGEAEIAIVSFEKFINGSNTEGGAVARQIYDAFSTVGWVYLKDHGIPQECVDGIFRLVRGIEC